MKKITIQKIDEWFKVRKDTTPVHWTFGALCGYVSSLSFKCFWVGFALMCMFAALEWWDDESTGRQEGCTDWWESFLLYGIIFFIMFILGLAIAVQSRLWPHW